MNFSQTRDKILAALKDERPTQEVVLFIKSFFDNLQNNKNPLALLFSLGSLLQYKGKTLRVLRLLASYSAAKQETIFNNLEDIVRVKRVRTIAPSTRFLRKIITIYFAYAEPDLEQFIIPVNRLLVAAKRPKLFEKTLAKSEVFLTTFRPLSTRGTTGVDLANSVIRGTPDAKQFKAAYAYLYREGLIDSAELKLPK